jgi:hypothetical protein
MFAAGTVVHPAETGDVAALGGRHVAAAVEGHLGGAAWPAHAPVIARPPLRWVAPNLVAPDGAALPRGRFLLRSDAFLRAPRLVVLQDGRALWSGRLLRLVPGRSAHIPGGWARRVDPDAGPVSVQVAD